MEVTKMFPREVMEAILWDGREEILRDQIIDHDRWSVCHELVFRLVDGTIWSTYYNQPATECQDGQDRFEDPHECVQVVPKDVTTVEYVPLEVPGDEAD